MSQAPDGKPPKKRSYGAGSVYQVQAGRQAGQWCAVYLDKAPDRPTRRRPCYGPTRTAAIAARAAYAAEHARQPSAGPAERRTVGAYLTAYVDDPAHRWAAPTRALYRQLVRDYMTAPPYGALLGDFYLPKLTPAHVARWLSELARRGVGVAPAHNAPVLLRQVLRAAVRLHELPSNPADAVDLPPKARPRTAHLDLTQARTLLTATRARHHWPLWALLLATGLRRGELLGLRWADVDWERRRLTVSGALGRCTRARQAPKTRQSARTLPLSDLALDALRAARARQTAQKAAALRRGAAWERTEYVFTTGTGGPLGGNEVTHAWRRDLAAAGVPAVTLHSTRHSALSFMAALGVPMVVAAAIAGHSRPGVTLEVYAHAAPADLTDGLARLGRLLTGTTEDKTAENG